VAAFPWARAAAYQWARVVASPWARAAAYQWARVVGYRWVPVAAVLWVQEEASPLDPEAAFQRGREAAFRPLPAGASQPRLVIEVALQEPSTQKEGKVLLEICEISVDPPSEGVRAILILKKKIRVYASPNADHGIVVIDRSEMEKAIDLLRAEGMESGPFVKRGRI